MCFLQNGKRCILKCKQSVRELNVPSTYNNATTLATRSQHTSFLQYYMQCDHTSKMIPKTGSRNTKLEVVCYNLRTHLLQISPLSSTFFAVTHTWPLTTTATEDDSSMQHIYSEAKTNAHTHRAIMLLVCGLIRPMDEWRRYHKIYLWPAMHHTHKHTYMHLSNKGGMGMFCCCAQTCLRLTHPPPLSRSHL